MARRRRKRRSKKSKMIPLAIVAPPLWVAVKNFQGYGLSANALDHIVADTTGYQPSTATYNVDWAKPFWMGEIAGIIVHKVANKVGVNRHLKKMTFGYLGL